ncbi:MAG: hypothetical protein IJC49_04320 [Clostridia bacterium]|nr:hypothetical protein [Clostridia bacterium]
MALKRFYSRLFVIGAVFLFNPIVGLVDLLPDFIGAFLIAASMTEIAMLDERIENARRLIYYVAGISAARTVLMFFMFNMDESWVLSIVSLLGAAELFALIYFAVSFFGGVSYIAQRSDSDNVLGGVDRIKNLWILFFIVRTAAAILPELTALPQLIARVNPEDLTWATERQIVMYRYYARLLLGTAALFLGIWWLKNTVSFMKGVRADERFKASLEKRFASFSEANPLHALFLDIRFALIMLTAGSALQMNFTADGKAVLPAWLGTACIFFALIRLCKEKNNYLFLIIIAFQAVAVHFFKDPLAAVVLCAVSPLAVYMGEKAVSAHVKQAIDWDIDVYFYITRFFYIAFFVLTAIYAFVDNYWLHLSRILCFGAWIAALVWTCSSVLGEIKLRRRL